MKRSIRVDDRALRRALQRSRTLPQALQPLAAKATRTAQQVAQERVSRQSGLYFRSFKSHVEHGVGNGVARIVTENDAPYAGYIESGTRPFVMPKKATVYAWESDSGEMVFTHGPIKQPAREPQRVIETALKRLARGSAF